MTDDSFDLRSWLNTYHDVSATDPSLSAPGAELFTLYTHLAASSTLCFSAAARGLVTDLIKNIGVDGGRLPLACIFLLVKSAPQAVQDFIAGFDSLATYFTSNVDGDEEALIHLCATVALIYKEDRHGAETPTADVLVKQQSFISLVRRLLSTFLNGTCKENDLAKGFAPHLSRDDNKVVHVDQDLQDPELLRRMVTGTLFLMMISHEPSRQAIIRESIKDSTNFIFVAFLARFLQVQDADEAYQLTLIHIFLLKSDICIPKGARGGTVERVEYFQRQGGLIAVFSGALIFYQLIRSKKDALPLPILEKYLLVTSQLLRLCAEKPVITDEIALSANVRKGYQALLILLGVLIRRQLKQPFEYQGSEEYGSIQKIAFGIGCSLWSWCISQHHIGDTAHFKDMLPRVSDVITLLQRFVQDRALWLFPLLCVAQLWTSYSPSDEEARRDQGLGTCCWCLERGTNMMFCCERCKFVEYCSLECRSMHLNTHAQDCDLLQAQNMFTEQRVRGKFRVLALKEPNKGLPPFREMVRFESEILSTYGDKNYISLGALLFLCDRQADPRQSQIKFEGSAVMKVVLHMMRKHRAGKKDSVFAHVLRGGAVFIRVILKDETDYNTFVIARLPSVSLNEASSSVFS